MRNIHIPAIPIIIFCLSLSSITGCGTDTQKKVADSSDLTGVAHTPTAISGDGSEIIFSEDLWRNPPIEYRPYVRWWWPGGAVQDSQLASEIELLASHGFGGVEIQPVVLGLTPEEIENNPQVRTVGTHEFFEKIRIAAQYARASELGFDITMGSGWSTGVPQAEDAAEKQLLPSA